MKYLFAIVFWISSSALAARPALTDAPALKPAVLAERIMNCGFFCPKRDQRGVRFYSDGKVTGFFKREGAQLKEEALGQLSELALKKFTERIKSFKLSALVDSTPDKPVCHDTPVVLHRILAKDSLQVIRQEARCHVLALTDDSGVDVVNLLDGFASLYQVTGF